MDKRKTRRSTKIISADKPEEFNLININIFHLDEKSKLIEKINAKSANIKKYLAIRRCDYLSTS